MSQELQHACRSEILDIQAVHRFADLIAEKRQQQLEAVAVALLRVAGETALGDDVIDQESSEPRAKRLGVTHGPLH